MSDPIGHNGGPPLTASMGNEGWVAIARGMRSHWLVGFGIPVAPQDPSRGSYSRAEAWIDLIMECRYAEGTVSNGGHRMELHPGQLLGPTSWLAARWNWTPKTVRGFIDKLAADGMIELFSPGVMRSSDEIQEGQKQGKQKGKQGTVITICNYSEYQVVRDDEGQAKSHAEGKQGASKGQAEGKQDAIFPRARANKETNKQIYNTPLTPLGGDAELGAQHPGGEWGDVASSAGQHGLTAEDIQDLIQKHIKVRLKSTRQQAMVARNAQRREESDRAFEIYNKAAVHFGFSVCEAMTDKRRSRLLTRLDDIGGVDAFRRALWAVRKDDFLAGRVSKPGSAPFRLDIDRLLSTGSGLGDVLARLLDLSNQPDEPLIGPNGKRWGWWRESSASLKALEPDFWRRRLDALKPNGVWPWWELGAPPGHDESVIHPDVVAERGLAEIYKGQIDHE